MVIGNKDYQKPEDKLKKSVNDAKNVGDSLSKIGFEVIRKTNLNRVDFEKAIDDFGHRLVNYESSFSIILVMVFNTKVKTT